MVVKKISLVIIGICCFCFLKAQQFYKQTEASQHWVDSVFTSLTPQQRIAQLMVVRESGQASGMPVFFTDKVDELIKNNNVGSICLFQGGPVKQANLINHFQQIAQTPLMVCIDGETGLGMRMTDSVTKFPDQLTLGAVQDAAIVYEVGKAIGAQCKREGIQVNYAPVVDINNNPNNPVINFRSFGEDKYKVALFGTQIMRGMQEQNIMACAKHFPGHGDVSVDSHLDLPVITKSYAALDSLELYPFKAMFNEGIGSVMIAHLSIPAIDNTPHLPTSLSQKNVTDLLRNKLGFQGISFTDALEMQGVAKYYPQGDAAVQSLIAGNDMLCLPGDVPMAIQKIQTAITNKTLDSIDIDNRVKKVLLVKYNLGLSAAPVINTNNLFNDLNKDVKPLKRKVAQNAITVLRLKDTALFPLKADKKIAYIGIGISDTNTLATFLHIENGADVYMMDYSDDASIADSIKKHVDSNYDAVVIGVHQFNKYPAKNFGLTLTALNLIKDLQVANHTITMVFGNPYALKNFCDADNLVACYDDDPIFQEAAYNWLTNQFVASGKLPVTVCNAFHYGDGIVDLGLQKLPEVNPIEAGIDSSTLYHSIDSLANNAIFNHATPGCVLLVAKDNKIVLDKAYGNLTYYDHQPTSTETVYDLASVTKISATTLAVMKLYEDGKLDINKTIGDYLPWVRGSNKSGLVLQDVLMHQAGMVAFIPFYKETIEANGDPKKDIYQSYADSNYSVPVAANMYMRKDWVDTMFSRILQSKVSGKKEYVYSDNDFIFLGKIIEQVTGESLDNYVEETFYQPMHLYNTTFKPNNHLAINTIAPTEDELQFREQLLRGFVHDPGAAMFGGVAGHAGLFSNVHDLAILYSMLLNGGVWDGERYLKKETIDFFTAYHSNISRRGFGFDKPEKDNAKRSEPYPCLDASPQAFGHSGFTGIWVWVDPKYNLLFIFLSNRVNPNGGDNAKLSSLNVRGKMLEAVYQSIYNK